jgi:hypothetical protein
MTTPTYADPQQQSQGQMMLWMMPLLFTFFSLSFNSGLALYWRASNVISIVMQYYITGWGGLATMFKKQPPQQQKRPPPRPAAQPPAPYIPPGGVQLPKKTDTSQMTGGTTDKGKRPWMFWK